MSWTVLVLSLGIALSLNTLSSCFCTVSFICHDVKLTHRSVHQHNHINTPTDYCYCHQTTSQTTTTHSPQHGHQSRSSHPLPTIHLRLHRRPQAPRSRRTSSRPRSRTGRRQIPRRRRLSRQGEGISSPGGQSALEPGE